RREGTCRCDGIGVGSGRLPAASQLLICVTMNNPMTTNATPTMRYRFSVRSVGMNCAPVRVLTSHVLMRMDSSGRMTESPPSITNKIPVTSNPSGFIVSTSCHGLTNFFSYLSTTTCQPYYEYFQLRFWVECRL